MKTTSGIIGTSLALALSIQSAFGSEACVTELRNDVYTMYLNYKDKFSGPMAFAAGIPLTYSCGKLSADLESIKGCLNGLKSVHNDYRGLDVSQWESYRQRWLQLRNTGDCRKPKNDNI